MFRWKLQKQKQKNLFEKMNFRTRRILELLLKLLLEFMFVLLFLFQFELLLLQSWLRGRLVVVRGTVAIEGIEEIFDAESVVEAEFGVVLLQNT